MTGVQTCALRSVHSQVEQLNLQVYNRCVGTRYCANNCPYVVDSNHSNLGEDLCGAICDCAGLIANVHLSDNLGVTDDHLPPGEGTIDWPGALRALGEAGYSGAVNLEIHWADTPPAELLVRLREWAEGAAKMVDAARWHRNQTTATANGSHGFRSTRSTASGMAADYDDDNDFLTADERGWTRIRPRTMFRGKRNT